MWRLSLWWWGRCAILSTYSEMELLVRIAGQMVTINYHLVTLAPGQTGLVCGHSSALALRRHCNFSHHWQLALEYYINPILVLYLLYLPSWWENSDVWLTLV